MKPIENITGVILAGGKSSRFGSNKALAEINGKLLIQRVTNQMIGLFDRCLLVTNTPDEYAFLSLPMTGDIYRNCGPLAGIHAALQKISDDRAFVVACDMPNLSAELIRYLCETYGPEYDVIIPWLEHGQEPLFGLYHKRSLAAVESCLKKGNYQIIIALEYLKVRRLGEREILSITGDLCCFKNINRPEDI